MARIAVPVSALAMNTKQAVVTGTALNTASGHVLTAPNDGRVLLQINNSGTADAFTATVKAGDNPPAFQAGLGDLVVTVGTAAATARVAIPLETARFLQDDGTINIDFAWGTGGAGDIAAYSFPRAF